MKPPKSTDLEELHSIVAEAESSYQRGANYFVYLKGIFKVLVLLALIKIKKINA